MNLNNFNEHYTALLVFLTKTKLESITHAHQLMLHWGLCLQGRTESRTSLSGENFSEAEYLKLYRDVPFFIAFYYVAKLNILYLFGLHKEANEISLKAHEAIGGVLGMIWEAKLCFFDALNLAALFPQAAGKDRKQLLHRLKKRQARMKVWAENSPENFRHQYLLISAEMAKLQNRSLEAADFYEEAIESADENGFCAKCRAGE